MATKAKRQPVAYVDYDPDGGMEGEDYMYLASQGAYEGAGWAEEQERREAEAEGAEGTRIVPVLSPVACQFCGREWEGARIGRMRNPVFDGEENLTFCPGYGCEQPPF